MSDVGVNPIVGVEVGFAAAELSVTTDDCVVVAVGATDSPDIAGKPSTPV